MEGGEIGWKYSVLKSIEDGIDGLRNVLRGKRVVFQLPDGLRGIAGDVARILETEGAEAIFSGEHCYGACDIPSYLFDIADVILHIGHEKMASLSFKEFNRVHSKRSSAQIIYLPINLKVDIERVCDAIINAPLSAPCLIITASQTYAHILPSIKKCLKGMGLTAVLLPSGRGIKTHGVVLGCNFSAAGFWNRKYQEWDVVFIGDGNFHPLGMALWKAGLMGSENAHVICARPWGASEIIDPRAFLRSRYLMVERTMDCKTAGIVLSTLHGQCRYTLARGLHRLAKKHGIRTTMIAVEHLSPDLFSHIGFDCIISTACPRIALDDYKNYDLPIITPQEFLMAMGILPMPRYVIDQIH
ncbi:MAG: diphthamide biosynthesis enzyme Dph2 [Thermoplasmata archaeon]|nr:MAG: diphthamide biosynthesis enzyme Dph2 [Thermoplasmata archaeon]